MTTRVEVALGGSVQLPCKCGGKGSESSLQWRDNRNEQLMLKDMGLVKVKGDCSLVLNFAMWEDQGEFVCAYLDSEFKFDALKEQWIAGVVTTKVVLAIERPKSAEVSKVVKKNQEPTTATTTTTENDLLTKHTTLGLKTTKSIHTLTPMTVSVTTQG